MTRISFTLVLRIHTSGYSASSRFPKLVCSTMRSSVRRYAPAARHSPSATPAASAQPHCRARRMAPRAVRALPTRHAASGGADDPARARVHRLRPRPPPGAAVAMLGRACWRGSEAGGVMGGACGGRGAAGGGGRGLAPRAGWGAVLSGVIRRRCPLLSARRLFAASVVFCGGVALQPR